ncbi:MAG: C45 family autoproteolytic acyltransferase/hydrolase [Bacteroidales bacterium]|nr:C45 family autoproteolytic acyltransferase/hydrolase [Bacteroidales bacterium]
MKRFFKFIFKTLLTVILIAVVAAALIWGREIRTVASVKQVGDNKYLYQMQYSAKYDLDEVMAANIDENSKLLEYVVSKVGKGIKFKINSSQTSDAGKMEPAVANCTSFQAKKDGEEGYWYGRNYDFFKNPTLVTVSHPKKGYASIAVSDMSHFGYSLDKVPDSFKNKVLCIASIYAPVDGINEKGLCTSIMALPNQASQQNTGKPAVGTTIIMRLFLDRCATVQEALDLLATVDVRHDAGVGSGYHYMVADAQGDCAVIEFDKNDGWKTMIVRKDAAMNYMHVTNHLLDPKYYTTEPDPEVGNPNSHSWERYAKVEEYLGSRNGVANFAEAQECLSLVHWKDLVWPNGMIEDTQYSNVYDQSAIKLYLRNWNDYDTTCEFGL